MNPYVVTSSASSHSNRVTLPPMMIYPESDHSIKLEANQNYHHHHHQQSSYTSSSLFHHSNLNGSFDSDYKSLNLIPSTNFKTYIKHQDSMTMPMPIPIPIPIKPLQISHSTNNFNEQDHSQSPFSLHESHQTHHQPDQRLSLSLLLAAANASDANIPSTPSTSIHHVNQSPTNVYTQNPSSPSWSSNLTGSSDQIIPPSSPHTPLDTPTYSEGKLIHKSHYPIYSDEFDPRKLQEVHYPTYKNEKIQEENLLPDEERWTSVSVMMRSNQSHQWSESPDLPSPPPSITKSNDHQLIEAAEECVGKVMKKRKNKRSIPWTAEKPKQGKKKRSVGYVRPIIKHRKRVGQRLLDMLKNSPIPSKCPPMEVNRARCFPFAEMESKLNEWYGLQIEWPKDGNFRMDELRSTRRMRQDELDRLDQTLDSGLVRIRLADWVLEEEPFRFNEFSYPSDGSDSSLDEHDLIEFDSSNGLVERTLRPEMS
ncbi:uncharacterized protein MELLADRAFT_106023 [Melampsora larici-populina 98AG31]|uniref:Uncharacterized protein n=1 Tax=Melampsora larici-populina (strain 98AG31 / pathotype 3-4-7) TaxID=747676 RepID=F4RK44_MELLP|nr:uncharacterized protein MELLADRAFT_106023 [Melampsora larici-populina 98AG31]EGG07035.1 hypothetical protein MELLADRAFT_106023 [Melampsora larici-populina 98AG31]